MANPGHLINEKTVTAAAAMGAAGYAASALGLSGNGPSPAGADEGQPEAVKGFWGQIFDKVGDAIKPAVDPWLNGANSVFEALPEPVQAKISSGFHTYQGAVDDYIQPVMGKVDEAARAVTGHTIDPIVYAILPDKIADPITEAIDFAGSLAPYIAISWLTGGAALPEEFAVLAGASGAGRGLISASMAARIGAAQTAAFGAVGLAGATRDWEAYKQGDITMGQFVTGMGMDIGMVLGLKEVGHISEAHRAGVIRDSMIKGAPDYVDHVAPHAPPEVKGRMVEEYTADLNRLFDEFTGKSEEPVARKDIAPVESMGEKAATRGLDNPTYVRDSVHKGMDAELAHPDTTPERKADLIKAKEILDRQFEPLIAQYNTERFGGATGADIREGSYSATEDGISHADLIVEESAPRVQTLSEAQHTAGNDPTAPPVSTLLPVHESVVTELAALPASKMWTDISIKELARVKETLKSLNINVPEMDNINYGGIQIVRGWRMDETGKPIFFVESAHFLDDGKGGHTIVNDPLMILNRSTMDVERGVDEYGYKASLTVRDQFAYNAAQTTFHEPLHAVLLDHKGKWNVILTHLRNTDAFQRSVEEYGKLYDSMEQSGQLEQLRKVMEDGNTIDEKQIAERDVRRGLDAVRDRPVESRGDLPLAAERTGDSSVRERTGETGTGLEDGLRTGDTGEGAARGTAGRTDQAATDTGRGSEVGNRSDGTLGAEASRQLSPEDERLRQIEEASKRPDRFSAEAKAVKNQALSEADQPLGGMSRETMLSMFKRKPLGAEETVVRPDRERKPDEFFKVAAENTRAGGSTFDVKTGTETDMTDRYMVGSDTPGKQVLLSAFSEKDIADYVHASPDFADPRVHVGTEIVTEDGNHNPLPVAEGGERYVNIDAVIPADSKAEADAISAEIVGGHVHEPMNSRAPGQGGFKDAEGRATNQPTPKVDFTKPFESLTDPELRAAAAELGYNYDKMMTPGDEDAAGHYAFKDEYKYERGAALRGEDTSYGAEGKVVDSAEDLIKGKKVRAEGVAIVDTKGVYPAPDRPKDLASYPEFVKNQSGIKRMRAALNDWLQKGAEYRFWYEESSHAIIKSVYGVDLGDPHAPDFQKKVSALREQRGGDMKDADTLAQFFAIMSANRDVPFNSNQGVRAYQSMKAGKPFENLNYPNQYKLLQQAIDGKAWEGMKTNHFYLAMLKNIDPVKFASMTSNGTTIDIWMMRAMGYLDDVPAPAQYQTAVREIDRLAIENGWSIDQAQAAIWVGKKLASPTGARTGDFTFADGLRAQTAQVTANLGDNNYISIPAEAPPETIGEYSARMNAVVGPLVQELSGTMMPENWTTGETMVRQAVAPNAPGGRQNPTVDPMSKKRLQGVAALYAKFTGAKEVTWASVVETNPSEAWSHNASIVKTDRPLSREEAKSVQDHLNQNIGLYVRVETTPTDTWVLNQSDAYQGVGWDNTITQSADQSRVGTKVATKTAETANAPEKIAISKERGLLAKAIKAGTATPEQIARHADIVNGVEKTAYKRNIPAEGVASLKAKSEDFAAKVEQAFGTVLPDVNAEFKGARYDGGTANEGNIDQSIRESGITADAIQKMDSTIPRATDEINKEFAAQHGWEINRLRHTVLGAEGARVDQLPEGGRPRRFEDGSRLLGAEGKVLTKELEFGGEKVLDSVRFNDDGTVEHKQGTGAWGKMKTSFPNDAASREKALREQGYKEAAAAGPPTAVYNRTIVDKRSDTRTKMEFRVNEDGTVDSRQRVTRANPDQTLMQDWSGWESTNNGETFYDPWTRSYVQYPKTEAEIKAIRLGGEALDFKFETRKVTEADSAPVEAPRPAGDEKLQKLIEDTTDRLTASESVQVAGYDAAVTKLAKAGIDTKDAEDAIQAVKDIVRSDYDKGPDGTTDFQEARDAEWQTALDAMANLNAEAAPKGSTSLGAEGKVIRGKGFDEPQADSEQRRNAAALYAEDHPNQRSTPEPFRTVSGRGASTPPDQRFRRENARRIKDEQRMRGMDAGERSRFEAAQLAEFEAKSRTAKFKQDRAEADAFTKLPRKEAAAKLREEAASKKTTTVKKLEESDRAAAANQRQDFWNYTDSEYRQLVDRYRGMDSEKLSHMAVRFEEAAGGKGITTADREAYAPIQKLVNRLIQLRAQGKPGGYLDITKKESAKISADRQDKQDRAFIAKVEGWRRNGLGTTDAMGRADAAMKVVRGWANAAKGMGYKDTAEAEQNLGLAPKVTQSEWMGYMEAKNRQWIEGHIDLPELRLAEQRTRAAGYDPFDAANGVVASDSNIESLLKKLPVATVSELRSPSPSFTKMLAAEKKLAEDNGYSSMEYAALEERYTDMHDRDLLREQVDEERRGQVMDGWKPLKLAVIDRILKQRKIFDGDRTPGRSITPPAAQDRPPYPPAIAGADQKAAYDRAYDKEMQKIKDEIAGGKRDATDWPVARKRVAADAAGQKAAGLGFDQQENLGEVRRRLSNVRSGARTNKPTFLDLPSLVKELTELEDAPYNNKKYERQNAIFDAIFDIEAELGAAGKPRLFLPQIADRSNIQAYEHPHENATIFDPNNGLYYGNGRYAQHSSIVRTLGMVTGDHYVNLRQLFKEGYTRLEAYRNDTNDGYTYIELQGGEDLEPLRATARHMIKAGVDPSTRVDWQLGTTAKESDGPKFANFSSGNTTLRELGTRKITPPPPFNKAAWLSPKGDWLVAKRNERSTHMEVIEEHGIIPDSGNPDGGILDFIDSGYIRVMDDGNSIAVHARNLEDVYRVAETIKTEDHDKRLVWDLRDFGYDISYSGVQNWLTGTRTQGEMTPKEALKAGKVGDTTVGKFLDVMREVPEREVDARAGQGLIDKKLMEEGPNVMKEWFYAKGDADALEFQMSGNKIQNDPALKAELVKELEVKRTIERVMRGQRWGADGMVIAGETHGFGDLAVEERATKAEIDRQVKMARTTRLGAEGSKKFDIIRRVVTGSKDDEKKALLNRAARHFTSESEKVHVDKAGAGKVFLEGGEKAKSDATFTPKLPDLKTVMEDNFLDNVLHRTGIAAGKRKGVAGFIARTIGGKAATAGAEYEKAIAGYHILREAGESRKYLTMNWLHQGRAPFDEVIDSTGRRSGKVSILNKDGELEHAFLGDVLSSPSNYTLNNGQEAYVSIIHRIIDDHVAEMRANGVDIKELGMEKLGEHYFPRFVIGKGIDGQALQFEFDAPYTKGAIGSKQIFEKARYYPSMAEGVAAGNAYAHPLEALEGFIDASNRTIAAHQFLNAIKGYSVTGKELALEHVGYTSRMKTNRKTGEKTEVRTFTPLSEASGEAVAARRAMKKAEQELAAAKRGGRDTRVRTDARMNMAELNKKVNELDSIKNLREKLAAATTDADKAALGTALKKKLVSERGKIRRGEVKTDTRVVGKQAKIDAAQERLKSATENYNSKRVKLLRVKNEMSNIIKQKASGRVTSTELLPEEMVDALGLAGDIRVRGVASVPALNGKLFPEAVADAIEKGLNDKGFAGTFDKVKTANDFARLARASTDFGYLFIQGLPVLTRNPVAFGKAMYQSLRTFQSPEGYAKWLASKKHVTDDMFPYAGGFSGSEYFTATKGNKIKQLADLRLQRSDPASYAKVGFGKGMQRFALSFESFLDAAKISMWEGMMPHLKTTAQKEAYGRLVRNMTGTTSTARLGVTKGQREIEGLLMFSPRFTRSVFALAAQAGEAGPMRAEAVRSIASLLGGAVIMYAGAKMALGQDIEPQDFNPTSGGRFMSVKVGNNWYGLGGSARGAIQLMGYTVAALHDPKRFVSTDSTSNDHSNPFLKYARGRLSPFASQVADFAAGSTVVGQDTTDRKAWLARLPDQFIPFGVQTLVETEGGTNDKMGAFLANMGGLRTFPEASNEDLNRSVAELAGDKSISRWSDMTSTQKVDLLEKHPELQKLLDKADVSNWTAYKQVALDAAKAKAALAAEWMKTQGTTGGKKVTPDDVTSKDYRDRLADINQRLIGARAALNGGNSVTGLGGTDYNPQSNTPRQRLMNAYYAAVDKNKFMLPDGSVDWELKDALTTSFYAQLTPQQRDIVDEETQGTSLDPLEKRLKSARSDFKPYWDLRDEVATKMGYENALAISLAPKPLQTVYNRNLSRAQEQFRRANPDIDQQLKLWGYTSKTVDEPTVSSGSGKISLPTSPYPKSSKNSVGIKLPTKLY